MSVAVQTVGVGGVVPGVHKIEKIASNVSKVEGRCGWGPLMGIMCECGECSSPSSCPAPKCEASGHEGAVLERGGI